MMRSHIVAFSLGFIAATQLMPNLVLADDDDRGLEIAIEADRRTRGYGDYQAKLQMILSDRRGQETIRELDVATLEVSENSNKALVYFHRPPDIRGTALLTYSNRNGDDEQWLYLPALRRTKRIAASNRSTPFMGSEFTYEDLSALYVDDFTYKFVGEKTLRDTECFVIERYPTYSGTGYSKQVVWFDKKEYRPLMIQFWDTNGEKLKSLAAGKYEKYEDTFWMPGEVRMINHQTKASTTLIWTDYEFGVGLGESDFSKSAIKRSR